MSEQQSLKVLHVFHSSDLNNGVDRITLTLASSLKALGCHPCAIVPRPGSVTQALDKHGIPWSVLPLNCCASTPWRGRATLRFLAETSARTEKITTLLKEGAFDVVHINTGHPLDAALAAAKTGVPVIWHIHSPFDIDYVDYAEFLSRDGYVWMLQELGSQVIAVSEDIRNDLLQYLRNERLHSVYNGIDVNDLEIRATQDTVDIRQELGVPASARLVLGVGRISQQKDFATFVKVAEQVAAADPDVYFAIAGPAEDKPLAAELSAAIQSYGLSQRVFILGARSDVPRLMQQCDVFLSTARFEGHPLTALEAMALGRPVVAMACVGLRECIVDGIDGVLTVLGDINATAQAVLDVLQAHDYAIKLGTAAKTTVQQRFSSRQFAERFRQVALEAIAYGPARVSVGALSMIDGLLLEIADGDSRLNALNQKSGVTQRLKRWIWSTAGTRKKTR